MVKEGDWVILKESVVGRWSGATRKIDRGTRGRALKLVEGNKMNVMFGMAVGIHAIDIDKLEVYDS